VTDPMPTVYGRCPACGWATLFLGEGGHVTCSSSDCPRPELIDELIGEIGDARHHGDYTFCTQLVGHVNMTAFAEKITEKVTAVAHRAEAVKYANEQKQRAEGAEAERDRAYCERSYLIALLAAMTDGAVIAYAADVDEPGWQIVYLTIGGRQCTWHIAPRDADLFQHVERVDIADPRAQWDGHTTEEKYEHIAAHTADLAQRCGPACSEMHTGVGRCETAAEHP